MVHRLVLAILGATVIVIATGCGGGKAPSQMSLARGEAVITRTGATASIRGRVGFVDANGQETGVPATGALVLIGTGTLAVGTNAQGEFTAFNLPNGRDLILRILATGFKPRLLTIPAADTSIRAGTMICTADADANDNPSFDSLRSAVDGNGNLMLQGNIPDSADLVIFQNPGPPPSDAQIGSFGNINSEVLPATFTPMGGGKRKFSVRLPTLQTLQFEGGVAKLLTTGSLFAFLLDYENGVAAIKGGTCGLNISPYSRTTVGGAETVGGTVVGPKGPAAGANVLIWENGNAANRCEVTSGPTGVFNGTLAPLTPPVKTPAVYIRVEWVDNSTNPPTWYLCYFAGM